MSDVFTAFEVIKDRYGKEHFIYAALFGQKDKVRHYMTKVNTDTTLAVNWLLPKIESDGSLARKDNGELEYSDESNDAIIELVHMALDCKESKEEVLNWLDLRIANEILEIFLDISSFKKKRMELTKNQSGIV